jgi:hypothetical protein
LEGAKQAVRNGSVAEAVVSSVSGECVANILQNILRVEKREGFFGEGAGDQAWQPAKLAPVMTAS